MNVVLDTTVLVDHLRGYSLAGEYIAALGAPPSCSEVTRIEILRGLRSDERRGAERLFALITWAPVDEEVGRRAGELGRRWRRSHPGIGVPDLAIAATAEMLEAQLATRNVKHFPMFEGLRAPY
ncbi:MAG TPA: type II toxin-antitoxin system VapC family toxin [Solirubrobacterales bacterium]|nr:type II toxin-antitoxin system VapC family toxin [Solirubrobacterales bacterium]